jgi:hypothetical protein
MSYTDVVICIGPDRFLETWPPIYRGQERPVRDRLKESQVDHHVYSRYVPCLTDFTFEFIQVNPRQLALTMESLGIGIMNSTAFSFLANSSPEVNEKQISFGTIDF